MRAGRTLLRTGAGALCAVTLLGAASLGRAADQPYPFEGTWVRADRQCTAQAPSARTYTARDLSIASGRCTLRRVVSGSGEYELFEDCRRPERSDDAVEKIRMLNPDLMVIKHQVNRLKIPRGRRYARCAAAAPKGPAPASRSPAPSTPPKS